MNRIEIIKKCKRDAASLSRRLKTNYKHIDNMTGDFARFCELEKEIQIQEAYLKHGQ